MSDLYEYQAIDGSSKGPVDLVLLLRARNLGRLSNRTLVRKVPGGDWRPLALSLIHISEPTRPY